MGGEHENSGIGELREDLPNRVDPVDPGHFDVEDHQVRFVFGHRRPDFIPVPGLVYDFVSGQLIHSGPDRLPDDPVIVTDQDPVAAHGDPMLAGAPYPVRTSGTLTVPSAC